MNSLTSYESLGIFAAIIFFVIAYIIIHVKYIRHHALHKRFLATLWEMMKNTIHGDHIRTMGYEHEKETRKEDPRTNR